MAKVYRQCQSGKIQPDDGSRYTYMLSQIGKVLEAAEVEAREADRPRLRAVDSARALASDCLGEGSWR
jgi:hypothetical protein